MTLAESIACTVRARRDVYRTSVVCSKAFGPRHWSPTGWRAHHRLLQAV